MVRKMLQAEKITCDKDAASKNMRTWWPENVSIDSGICLKQESGKGSYKNGRMEKSLGDKQEPERKGLCA